MGDTTSSEIEYLARALKAPRIRDAATRLAEQARQAAWTHEEYLAAVLSREVSAREASGAEIRIRAAGFPARKSLEDFNFDHQPALRRDTIAHLATGSFLAEAQNVVLLGPPGTGNTHLAIGLGLKAAHAGHRVLFATAVEWVARLQTAHHLGRLPHELVKLRRYGLVIVDEVGYIPFEQDAANPFFQLVSSRYEHASLILTSNLAFARWGDVFGDQIVAAAMIDRIVHHADVLTLKGTSYRLHNTGIESLPSVRAENAAQENTQQVAQFSPPIVAQFSTVVDRHPARRHGEAVVARSLNSASLRLSPAPVHGTFKTLTRNSGTSEFARRAETLYTSAKIFADENHHRPRRLRQKKSPEGEPPALESTEPLTSAVRGATLGGEINNIVDGKVSCPSHSRWTRLLQELCPRLDRRHEE